MGFFSKKPRKNKIYSLQEAMELISTNEGYSVAEEGNGYKVIPDEVASSVIERYKARNRDRDRLMFQENLRSGVSDTIDINPIKNSNYSNNIYNYGNEER